jgi:hypothetical protein
MLGHARVDSPRGQVVGKAAEGAAVRQQDCEMIETEGTLPRGAMRYLNGKAHGPVGVEPPSPSP